jgi:hypothetical protein
VHRVKSHERFLTPRQGKSSHDGALPGVPEPKYDEFRPRTIWSLSNAFTSAFKELDAIPQFKETAKLSEFLEAQFPQSF